MSPTSALTVDALLFDKDGTLFDFAATWEAWAKGLLNQLSKGDEARAQYLGDLIGFDYTSSRFDPNSIAVAGTPDDIAVALHAAFPEKTPLDILKDINDQASAAAMIEAVPLAPLLQSFRDAGLKLGVATNDAEAPARAHLQTARISSAFEFVVGSDSGYGAKPATGQLLAFCDQVGVAPERTAMVGDSTHDLEAGRSAGMRTIAVLTGLAEAQNLAPFADVVFPDIGHIPDWIGLT